MLWLLQNIIFLFLWFGTVHGCVDSYLDFEEQTFGNNSENRLKLYQAFYPPNTHLPYSLVVTYQAVLSNGAQVNISTDPSCPYTQVWIWLSSPVFLYLEPTSLNRHTLFMLNYFEEWIPPHVTITTPYPCQDQAEGFLQEITTLLQSYAVGESASGRFKGNVARACGADSYIFIDEGLAIATVLGLIMLGLFLLFAIPVVFQRNRHFKNLAKNANDYSFKSYGLFWGASATLFVFAIPALCSDLRRLILVFHNIGTPLQAAWVLCVILLFFLTAVAALFIALTSTFAIPRLYLLLAKLCCFFCCCCKGFKSPAHTLVMFLAVWIDMLALQLLCHHGVVAVLATAAAPLTIVTNVLFLGSMGICVSHTFAFVFALCAKLKNSHVQKCKKLLTMDGCKKFPPDFSKEVKEIHCIYYVRAGILIPFLIAIVFFSSLLAFSGKYVNSATEQISFPAFLLSFFIPILLTGIGLGLHVLILRMVEE